MNRNKILLGIAISSMAIMGTGIVIVSNNNISSLLKAGNNNYSCASVHFGMNDETCEGIATLTGGSISIGTYEGTIGDVNGITMVSYKVEGQAIYKVEDCGLKMSSSKNDSVLTLTFDEKILECDIYAIGWNKDTSYLTINDNEDEKTLVKSSSSIAGSGTVSTKYEKYHFNVNSNELKILSTKRLVIGDICLRWAVL